MRQAELFEDTVRSCCRAAMKEGHSSGREEARVVKKRCDEESNGSHADFHLDLAQEKMKGRMKPTEIPTLQS